MTQTSRTDFRRVREELAAVDRKHAEQTTPPPAPAASSQLRELARPFPSSQVKKKPGQGGGDYVEHNTVTERLLWNVGPFDQHVTQIIRDGGEQGPIVAVILRLTVTVDGRQTVIEECGEVEHPGNWKHDGQRLKVAVSDGIKRCAMRFGCGLHLWSQNGYFLPQALDRDAAKDGAA